MKEERKCCNGNCNQGRNCPEGRSVENPDEIPFDVFLVALAVIVVIATCAFAVIYMALGNFFKGI